VYSINGVGREKGTEVGDVFQKRKLNSKAERTIAPRFFGEERTRSMFAEA